MADIVYPGDQVQGTLGRGLMPANYDLEIWRGDYFPMSVVLRNPGGQPLDLTGYTARASIRATYSSEEAFEFVTDIDELAGRVTITLPSLVSKEILPGSYIWDFQVSEPNGNTRTYMAGDVKVHDEVTR